MDATVEIYSRVLSRYREIDDANVVVCGSPDVEIDEVRARVERAFLSQHEDRVCQGHAVDKRRYLSGFEQERWSRGAIPPVRLTGEDLAISYRGANEAGARDYLDELIVVAGARESHKRCAASLAGSFENILN